MIGTPFLSPLRVNGHGAVAGLIMETEGDCSRAVVSFGIVTFLHRITTAASQNEEILFVSDD
jgi:hypothetical protein